MVTRTEMMIEGKRVIHELEHGIELANQLMNNLKCSSSDELNRSLISEILCSYQKAIVLLNFGGSPAEQTKACSNRTTQNDRFSDMDFKNVFKKRKISEKEFEKVRVSVGRGSDGSCNEDGYCWRKYGQKEILGSKNPRGYYRCTHRFTQGCLAVKQVQRSDTDPSVLEVKYLGTHTCDVTATAAASNCVFVRKTEHKPHGGEQIEDMTSCKSMKPEDMILNPGQIDNKRAIFRTFSFSKVEPENSEWKSGIFLENLMENLSPATSGSVITASELMSATTSVTTSPTGDSYFSSFDDIINFDIDFSFDSYPELLS